MKTVNERFLTGFEKQENGCWEWQRAKRSGYGKINVTEENNFKTSISAHRLSYELFNGEIPAGLHILHKCNNKACVNPGHLYTGTQRDNADDMLMSGDWFQGENNPNSRLLAVDVVNIRKDRKEKRLSYQELSDKYGVGSSQIREICLGLSWKNVPQ